MTYLDQFLTEINQKIKKSPQIWEKTDSSFPEQPEDEELPAMTFYGVDPR